VTFAERNKAGRQSEMNYFAEYKSQLEIARYDKVPIGAIAHTLLLAQWSCWERGI
jgi:hypothetical protein